MSPGWPEVAVALLSYLLLLFALAMLLLKMPDDQAALRGITGMAINGVAGTLAFMAAWVLRIRGWAAFGFRRTSVRWLLIGAAVGVVAMGFSVLLEHVYFMFVVEPNTQGDFQAAARAGLLPLTALVVAGALLTPLGEELVFRGVIANVLNRYGAWPGVVGSAALFAAVHGFSVIFLNAFLVGILTGLLLRKTGSLWPGVVVHVVFNGLWLLVYSVP